MTKKDRKRKAESKSEVGRETNRSVANTNTHKTIKNKNNMDMAFLLSLINQYLYGSTYTVFIYIH